MRTSINVWATPLGYAIRGLGLAGPQEHFALGAYTPDFTVIPGAEAIDPNLAENACTGSFNVPQSWPPAMTDQTVKFTNMTSQGDVGYVLYEKRLYKLVNDGGGHGHLEVCSAYDPNALAPQTCPPGFVFNPQTQNCEMAPGPGNQCPPGSIYNNETGKCEASGVNPINLPPPSNPSSSGGMSTGTVVGLAVGALALGAIAAYAVHESQKKQTAHR